MSTATLTTKGQITIPKQIRDHLRLTAGDRLEFVLDDRGVVTLRPARRAARDLYGFLERPGTTLATVREIDEEMAEVVAADLERIARGG